MSTTPTTTYHYRLYAYVNGLGERIYKAKTQGWLGMWQWVRYTHRRLDWTWTANGEWSTREDALSALYAHAQKRLNKEQAEELALKKRTLTLVVREDVPISVGGESAPAEQSTPDQGQV